MSKVGSTLELERGFKSVVELVEIGGRRGTRDWCSSAEFLNSAKCHYQAYSSGRIGRPFQPDRPGLIHGGLPDFWLPGKITRCSPSGARACAFSLRPLSES